MITFGKGDRIAISPEGRIRFESQNGQPTSVNDKTSIHQPSAKISSDTVLTPLCTWLEAAYQQMDTQARMALELLPDGKRGLILKEGTFRFPSYSKPLDIEHTDEELNAAGIRCITWLLEALSKQQITHTRTRSGQVSTWSMPQPRQSDGPTGLQINPLLRRKA